jgi:hypothetical protein
MLRHVIKMSVAPALIAQLDQVRDALSHSHPAASLETLLSERMRVTLAARARRTRAETDRPRDAIPAPAHSRHIRRPSAGRSGGATRGAAPLSATTGNAAARRTGCSSTTSTRSPRGGPTTVANIRLACAGHNDLFPRHDYGDAFMDRFSRSHQRA